MPTKSEIGLSTLYHASPSKNVSSILCNGLTFKPIWLSYYKDDAYRSALDHSKSSDGIALFAVNLPSNWELELAETAVYHSWKTIPSRYIRRIK